MTALLAVGAVTLGTLGLGAWGVRFVRTTSDLLVASRSVTPWWNAAAISGEYLSAASFLGIAGLEMQVGVSALWQALGFTAGYLALLLFVAAPLRRFGSYTIPDFAEARLRSPPLRMLAAVIVLLIGGFYLVPQLKGAGLALNVVSGAPYWVGVVVVAVIVAVNVAIGGMRGITYVQAFQFWIKVFAISVPACVLLIHFGGLPGRAALFGDELPRVPGPRARGGRRRAGAVPGGRIVLGRWARRARRRRRTRAAAAGRTCGCRPVGSSRTPTGSCRCGARSGRDRSAARARARPCSCTRCSWRRSWARWGCRTSSSASTPTRTATRRATRPCACWRCSVCSTRSRAVYGALGRTIVPQLYVTGQTDDVVLRLPTAAWPGPVGTSLGALLAAGAFAAFLSTSSGLLVSMAGTISPRVWPRLRHERPHDACRCAGSASGSPRSARS